MTISPKQAENTRVAYAIMYGIPHERIDLDLVRDYNHGEAGDTKFLAPNCNTSGCVAGFLSAHPFFKEQGLKWKKKENAILFKDKEGIVTDDLSDISEELFGSYHLFGTGQSGIDGKMEALERIREHLHGHGVINDKRNDQLCKMELEVYEAAAAADSKFD